MKKNVLFLLSLMGLVFVFTLSNAATEEDPVLGSRRSTRVRRPPPDPMPAATAERRAAEELALKRALARAAQKPPGNPEAKKKKEKAKRKPAMPVVYSSEEEEVVEIKKKPRSVKRARKTTYPEEDVILEEGKGGKGTGGGDGGFFWRVKVDGSSAGKVYINWINEPPIGPHASIQIFLNKTSQGKHIGRWAYKQACELSGYDTVYAHMRKSNTASQLASQHAGFSVCTAFPTYRQLLMKWVRAAPK